MRGRNAGAVRLALAGLAFFISAGLAGTGCSEPPAAARTDEVLSALPATVEQQMKDWPVPGLAIGIVKDGEVIFAEGFGYRDREAQLPVTTKTLFPIASCSKTFTAMSAAIAADEGLLEWDTPIKEYVPDFRLADEAATNRATLRDFLRHRSGLSGFRQIPVLSGIDREELYRRLRYIEPESELGKAFSYSNLGYTVAGHVVGRAAGMAWEDYVRAKIFEPLGMTGACFTPEAMVDSGDYAQPYMNVHNDDCDLWPIQINIAMAPAGGIIANLEDMLVWLKFNMAGGSVNGSQLVSPERLREMQTKQSDTYPDSDDGLIKNQGYGLGWHTDDYRGYSHLYHGGLYNGYTALVGFLPEEQIGVVVLSNMYYHHLCYTLEHRIEDLLLGLSEVDHHGRELEGCHKAFDAWHENYDAFWDEADPGSAPSHALEEYDGEYSHPVYGPASVTLGPDQATLTFASGVVFELKHFSGDTFAADHLNPSFDHLIVSFESDAGGKVAAFTLPLDGVEARFER